MTGPQTEPGPADPTGPHPTIAAVATGPAPGGVGIVRVSGPCALSACVPLVPAMPASPQERRAYWSPFLARDGAPLDEGLALFFRGPRSFTGEDVVELHAHGSPRVLSLLLEQILADGRVRPAAAGEFTRRAFLNGRVDLARAEAVAELVAAESEAAVRAAAAQLRGELGRRLAEVLGPLRALWADLEGSLDFPEEALGAGEDAGPRLVRALAALEALVEGARGGRLLRRGPRVVLFGPVNAGKSSLFNRLVDEERALVDEEPGTTRDVVEARLEWRGMGLQLVDTAGLREEPGRLEAMGIARGLAALGSADLGLLLVPPGAGAGEIDHWRQGAGAVPVLEVRTMADLAGGAAAGPGLWVCALDGTGLEALRGAIAEQLYGGRTPSEVVACSDRQLDALVRAKEAVSRALRSLEVSTVEVVAGELGLAVGALMEVTGEDASQALLDDVFGRFCIGK